MATKNHVADRARTWVIEIGTESLAAEIAVAAFQQIPYLTRNWSEIEINGIA